MKTNTTFYQYLRRAGVKPPAGVPNFTIPFKPWTHQAQRLRSLMQEDRFGLYDDCATGKTFVMQAAAIVHKANGYRTMVIMPPTLLMQFQASLVDTFEGIDDYMYVHRMTAVKSKKGVTAAQQREAEMETWDEEGWPDVLLMSYQMFVKSFVQKKIVKHYQIYMVDEAHELRNIGNKADTFLHEIINDPRRESALVLSTATPQYRDPLDAYSLIRLTNPTAYSSIRNFKRVHVIYKKRIQRLARPVHGKSYTVIYTPDKFIGLKTLQRNLYAKAARITKDKVLPGAKPTIVEEIVEISDAHLRYYRDYSRARIAELPDGTLIASTNAQSLRQELLRITTNVHKYTDKVKPKDNAIFAMCDTLIDGMGLKPDNKIVLFANSRTSIASLNEYYQEYNPALMYGAVDSEKGRDKFLNDKKCLMLISNPESAGAGLNLQSVCSTFIFVEPVTVPGLFKQASERFPRAGQKRPVVGYVLRPLWTLASTMTGAMLEREGYILAGTPDKESFLLEIRGERNA